MHRYSRTHLSDTALVRTLRDRLAQERATTAELLADLGEVDARRLYAPAGYPSMFAFCTGELRLSEDAAAKRIQAARAARLFPAIFDRLADGRLNLTAVVLLAPHLARDNADELLTAATHGSSRQIEEVLARRFPRQDLPARVTPPAAEHAARHVQTDTGEHAARHVGGDALELSAEPVAPAPAQVKPLSADGYGLQCTLPAATYRKLERIQELLGHDAPNAALASVLDGAFDAYLTLLERRRRAAASRPRPARHGTHASTNPRHVPAAVRRAVWARDGSQCTFVSDAGHRCEARTHLELDHVEPVARGGRSTESNLRLRCRAHNQLAADQAFGAGFMSRKRCAPEGANARVCAETAGDEAGRQRTRATEGTCGEPSRRALTEHVPTAPALPDPATRAPAPDRALAEARAQALETARAATEAAHRRAAAEEAQRHAAAEEIVPCLRRLGLRVEIAREVALVSGADPNAPFEERVRGALRHYGRLRYSGVMPATAA
jgi:5-methylcytosine-specific restriction endonuclease McrA